MSHTVNLKKKLQAPTTASKRPRPLQDSPKPKTNGINGIIDGHTPEKSFTAHTTHDAKRQKTIHHDVSNVVVGRPEIDARALDHRDVVEISDDEEEDEDEIPSGTGEDAQYVDNRKNDITNNLKERESNSKSKTGQEELGRNARPEDQAEEGAEGGLSFGEMLRARGSETVDVEASVSRQAPGRAFTPATSQALSEPTAISLGSVLTQALRTNDKELLESCLLVPNLATIRATIERLHPSLATALLQRLAERMHKRPGRAGSLMVWIQWTIVAHGNYLAGQSAVTKELGTLYTVVKQRATSLGALLALKGKLDLLEAQLQIRRNMQGRSGAQDTAGVVYVEGQEEEIEDDENLGVNIFPAHPKIKSPFTDSGFVDDSEDDYNAFNLPNGVQAGEEDEEASTSDEDEGDLIDDEAEDTEDDESDELSEDIEYDDDSDDEQEEDEDGVALEDQEGASPQNPFKFR